MVQSKKSKKRKVWSDIIEGYNKEVDTKVLKEYFKKDIKKQESPLVKTPTAHYKGHKLHTIRPHGTSEALDKASKKEESQKQFGARDHTGRVSTGISELDDVMGGGFRKNTVNLVSGGPGSGKTILGMQFLVEGIDKHDEPGVYITFEQTEEELLSDMSIFNWSLEDKIKQKKLAILCYTPEQVEKVLRAGGGVVRDVIQGVKAKRVVLDSLTAFTMLYERVSEQRKACLSLFRAIKRWDCTALLVAEQEGRPEVHNPSIEEFEVDGVILLYNIRTGYIRQRALEVFKIRGSKHPVTIYPMSIDDTGIRILPKRAVF